MAHTKVTKTGTQNTGAVNTFSYSGSFDVFKATEVVVSLDAINLTYTASTINDSASPREYTVDVAAKTLHIGGADLAGSNVIVIRPVTDMGAPTPRATYAPGASITSADLNNNQTQLMRKAMEYDEQKMNSTGGTMTGNLHLDKDIDITFEGSIDNSHETTLTVVGPTGDRTLSLPDVTGTLVSTGDTLSVSTAMLADGAVTSGKIANATIQGSNIAAATITGSLLGTGAVSTAKIAADAVDGTKIADDAIDSEHYAAASIDNEHLADDAVDSDEIASGAIDLDHMSANSVDSDQYVDGSIDLAHMSANSVDSDQYVDGSIDHVHLANDCIDSDNLQDDIIDSEHYIADSIDQEHLAPDCVGADELASNAVVNASIDASAAIAHSKLAALSDTNILVGNGSNIPVGVAVSGDVTIANTGAVTIAADAVEIGMIGCEQTTLTDSDSHIPTSGAVVDYVAAQIDPIGGLEVIATDAAFPEVQPASGVVISIADAGGLVVNGSGVSTTGRTVASTPATVTINGINSQFNSTTITAGVAMMVSSTGSGHIYNYHKATLREQDILSISTDIEDFGNRYRVHAGEPSSNNDEGDLVYDTSADKMKVYDSTTSAWKEVTSTGDFKYLFLCPAGGTGAPTIDGSIATYDLRESSHSGAAASVTNAAQLIVSVNGVVQKANTGTSAPAEGFALVDANTIIFSANLPSSASVFIHQAGSAVSIPTPGDDTVSAAKISAGAVIAAKIGTGAVETAKLAADAVDGTKLADNACDSEHYTDGSIDHVHLAGDAVDGDNIADDSINSEHYVDGSIDHAHLAGDCVDGVNIADDSIGAEHIADNAVGLAAMASGTDGQIITYDASGNPTAVGPGTDGQVLTSTGAGSPPAFEDAGGGLYAKAWYDSDATETTITNSSGETRVGGNSGTDLEVVWTPPSTSTKYVYVCYLHFRFSLGGQWGWQPEFTSNNWTSKTGIGNHPSYGNEYPNEIIRTGLVQIGHFHPNTTSECKMGLFATVWSSHSASIVLNGSLNKSRIFLYEVADPQANFSGI